ncbi:MAG: HD-GYP domain-containing protein [Desulfarculus sp.]|nr:HD-GYP domain-containing protein [Desulfarculus sp.]
MSDNVSASGSLGFVERPLAKADQAMAFNPAAHGMLPVSLEVLPAEETCPCDLFLPLYNQQRARVEMTLVCGQGQGFKEAWRQRLLAAQQRSAFVPLDQGQLLRAYFQDLAAHKLDDPEQPVAQKRLLLREMASLGLRELFAGDLSPQVVGQAVGGIQVILERLTADELILTNLSEILRSDYNTYSHSVNVSLLAMALGRHLKLTEPRVQALGMAGMLHDLGRSKLPPEMQNKPGPLDEQEWALMRTHPHWGHRLLSHVHLASMEVLKAVLHHHENADGSGYPHGITAQRTPLPARLLRLVDAFDAMTSNRPYRPAMYALEAASTIMRSPQHFDEDLIPHFLRFLASPHMIRKQGPEKG